MHAVTIDKRSSRVRRALSEGRRPRLLGLLYWRSGTSDGTARGRARWQAGGLAGWSSASGGRESKRMQAGAEVSAGTGERAAKLGE